MKNFLKLNINEEIKSYLLGFLFSFVLTTIPFVLAMQKIFSSQINYIIFLLCAVSQIIIHFVFFLHLNSSKERWNLITLLFVIIIIFIVVFGSIWIMCNLNHHMI